MNESLIYQEKNKKILFERAQKIAHDKEVFIDQNQKKILVFHLGETQKYAIDFDNIERITPYQTITPIPGINPLFAGLLYHISEIWPVIHLKNLFELAGQGQDLNFILLHDDSRKYAFCVGEIVGKMEFSKTVGLTQITNQENSKNPYIRGIYKEDIAVIDTLPILKVLRTISLT